MIFCIGFELAVPRIACMSECNSTDQKIAARDIYSLSTLHLSDNGALEFSSCSVTMGSRDSLAGVEGTSGDVDFKDMLKR